MPVDRAFAMKGFGAVVTGTLIAGEVQVEDEVLVYPAGRPARVRGIQVHGESARRASAGQRTALNLAGVGLEEIHRGQTVAANAFRAVSHIDTRLTLLGSAKPLKNRAPVHFHAGTVELQATVTLLDRDKPLGPGEEAWARLTLSEPTLVLPGDRFIIRLFSPVVTIGGGVVADLAPPRRPAVFATRTERLAALASDRVGALVRESAHGLAVKDVIARTGLRREEFLTPERVYLKEPDWLLDPAWVRERGQALVAALGAFHKARPLLPGMSKEELRAQMPAFVFEHLLKQTPGIAAEGDFVRLSTHEVVMQVDESAAVAKIEALFADAGLAVPAVGEVLAKSGVDQKRAQTLLATLLREKKLVRVNAELVFHGSAIAGLRASLAGRKGERFAVPEFKDWTGVSRKYAIPLLEYLDRERVTRREGDSRVIL
jgi:selenocysteine-specific elongation factor